MARYYLSPIIGTGTESNPYRPKIADYGVSWACVIQSNTAGHPAKAWCLVLVEAPDQTALRADADLDDFPEVLLDSALSRLSTPVRNRISTALSKIGLTMPTGTFGDLVRVVGRALDLSFDVAHLRVG